MAEKRSKIPIIYLETSIFNFPFADDAPQYKADALKLFKEIQAGKFIPVTSSHVIEELDETKETAKKDKMKAFITQYNSKVLASNDNIITPQQPFISE